MTITEFARAIDYTVSAVSGVELGRFNGSPNFLRAAAKVLNCSVAEITDGRVEDARLANRVETEAIA